MSEYDFFRRLKGVAIKAAYNTTDAYSFGAFGITEWIKCAEFLEGEFNFNEREIMHILRSKHMRWARMHRVGIDDVCTVDTFKAYVEGNSKWIKSTINELRYG